jgi:hypothetical protein
MIAEKSLGLVGILDSHFGNENLEILMSIFYWEQYRFRVIVIYRKKTLL